MLDKLHTYLVRLCRVLSIAVIASMVISCNNGKKVDESVLASINEYQVTEDHFKSAFLRYYYKSGQSLEPNYSIKSDILNNEFNVYVLATYASELGLDNSSETLKMKGMIERKVLNEEYLDRVILSDINVSEAEIQEMFVKLNTQLRASHLYASSKEKADSLYVLLEQGVSFDELAASTFKNERLAENGGELGVFSVDEMDVAFEREAYQMKVGDVSAPVRTAQGYSIIKLDDKITKPVMTEYELASQKQQIAYLAEKQEREMLTREHMYTFVDHFDINHELTRIIWEIINNNYSAFQMNDLESLDLSEFQDQELGEYKEDSFSISVEEFVTETQYTPASNLNRIKTKQQFEKFVTGIAYRKYLLEKAMQEGLDEIKEVNASIEQSIDVYMAEIAQRNIRESVEVADSEIRETYYRNPSKYVSPLKMDLSRIVVSSKEEAHNVLDQLNSGASFSSMVREHSIRNEEKLYDGHLGYVNIQRLGFLSPELSKLKAGEISEALFYQTGEYHIYKCDGRLESKPLSFKESYDLVKEEVTERKYKALRSEIIEKVKKRNGAIIDTQKLKEITIEI